MIIIIHCISFLMTMMIILIAMNLLQIPLKFIKVLESINYLIKNFSSS